MRVKAVVERAARWPDAVPRLSSPRVGLSLVVASALVTIVVAALGPSVVTLNLGPEGWLPPWRLPVGTPHEWPVTVALWWGIILGGLGLWVLLRALDAGWRPGWKRLFGLGAALNVLTVLVAPLTSADVLMYAAYGRLVRLGVDPYAVTPAAVLSRTFDPLLAWTEGPWQDTPSVYGPLATASQWLANVLGGESMHDVVWWLQVFGMVPLLVIGAVLVAMAGGDEVRQARAVLFTVLNPLVIWAVVAGAHNEALCVVFAVCALASVRRSAFVTGVFIGLAGTVKVTLVFYGLALAWGYRRDWRRLLALGLGALLPLAVAYGLVPQALFAASRNTGYISQGSWGLPVVFVLQGLTGEELARSIVTKVGWVLLVVIAWMLSRVLPWDGVSEDFSVQRGSRSEIRAENPEKPNREPRHTQVDTLTPVVAETDQQAVAVRTAAVLSAAWVITSPWTLPWYDLIAWAPLALLAANRVDRMLIWRGVSLSVAHVTARAVVLGPELTWMSWLLREMLCSVVQWGVLVWIAVWWWRAGHELPTGAFVRRGWARLRG
ncbi:hypothetical protein SAMN06266982_10949 [Propioniciclava tarda]|nr:hypothetical protein SAMN06266982_10949 [Propioniciclava tarda]